jgi:SAM-dependent methyltransferase
MLALLEGTLEVGISGRRMLDFGCHDGTAVNALCARGLDVSGVDVADGKRAEDLRRWQNERVRYTPLDRYRIPWDDDTFDVAISHHVFEHVHDYDTTLRELRRVLKPDGVMLNVFPSRWRVLEAHWYTPFGGVLSGRWWITLWGLAGLKKPVKRHYRGIEYGALGSKFIAEQTNYLLAREIAAHFDRYFGSTREVTVEYLEQLKGVQVENRVLRRLLAPLIAHFHVHVLLSMGTPGLPGSWDAGTGAG